MSSVNYFRNSKGNTLYERSLEELSASYEDSKIYKRFLEKYLESIDRDSRILEVGTGDGRITRHLLAMGFNNIVISDCNRVTLERFYDSLSSDDQQKLDMCACDICDLELLRKNFDAIIAIEVLYYLNKDFETYFRMLSSMLVPNGVFIHSEPTIEGALLDAICREDWYTVTSVLDSSRKIEADGLVKSRVFSYNELSELTEGTYLEYSDIIPILISTLMGKIKHYSDALNVVRKVREYTSEYICPRCIISCRRKL